MSRGKISVMICHIAECKNSIRNIENRFAIFYFFCFFNAVWALMSGGFCIVSDTLVFTFLLNVDIYFYMLQFL